MANLKKKKFKKLIKEIYEAFPQESFIASNGKTIIVKPISIIYFGEFMSLIGNIFQKLADAGKENTDISNLQVIFQYAGDELFSICRLAIGDEINGLQLKDIFPLLRIVLDQNYDDEVKKNVPILISKIGLNL